MNYAQPADRAAPPARAGSTGPIGRRHASVTSKGMALAAALAVVQLAGCGGGSGAGGPAMSDEAVARRIQPVGMIEVAEAAGAGATKTGEQVYNAQCTACHATGVANSPKLGDEAAWAPRIKTGYEALLTSALKGKGAMAPQIGQFGELEIGRAVVFMANKAGAKFDEPKAPAAAAGAASAAAK